MKKIVILYSFQVNRSLFVVHIVLLHLLVICVCKQFAKILFLHWKCILFYEYLSKCMHLLTCALNKLSYHKAKNKYVFKHFIYETSIQICMYLLEFSILNYKLLLTSIGCAKRFVKISLNLIWIYVKKYLTRPTENDNILKI